MTEDTVRQPKPDENRNTAAESSPISPLTDTDFMREKIKQRPINRGKLFRRTLLTVSLAIVFGLVACLTFLLLEPVFNRALNPEPTATPDPVVFPEEHVDEEVPPEDLIADDAEMQRGEDQNVMEVIDNYVFDVSDYNEMYASLRAIATDAEKSMVTVTGTKAGADWWGGQLETDGTSSGLVVADNGFSLLILTDYIAVQNTESVHVTFRQGEAVPASLLSHDVRTGLCVLSVSHKELPESIREDTQIATLGSSLSVQLPGSPVIAIGSPAGTPNTIVYGMITGNGRILNLSDANFTLLTTDIMSQPASGGVLINTNGEVLGVFTPTLTAGVKDNGDPQLTAYGISSVRKLIEQLSNRKQPAYLGVYGTEVPADIRESEDIPQGAYITRIATDSPAMDAGIQSGDVIVRVGTTDITSYASYTDAVSTLSPDETIAITLMRLGPDGYTEMDLEAVLTGVPG